MKFGPTGFVIFGRARGDEKQLMSKFTSQRKFKRRGHGIDDED
jgi:hypothetical protein